MTSKPQIAVVYLARRAEGANPVRNFLSSYLAHDAGEPHDLIIVFKGYGVSDPEFSTLANTLEPVNYKSFHTDDSGIDITAYLRAAEKFDYRSLCFLNTFSEVTTDGWLAKLASNLHRPGVGVVGASGSYESLYSSFRILMKATFLCATVKIPYDVDIARHFGFWIKHHAPDWLTEPTEMSFRTRVIRDWNAFRDYANYRRSYEKYWANFVGKGTDAEWLTEIPQFPNPHIRSNGFMIGRERLLGFGFPKIVSKEGGCLFESGSGSMTARLRRAGLAALVVGKNGVGYDVADWPDSTTFRLGRQDNMLIVDNQVRQFADFTPEMRAIHSTMTWGDYLESHKAKFHQLGLKFRRATDHRL